MSKKSSSIARNNSAKSLNWLSLPLVRRLILLLIMASLVGAVLMNMDFSDLFPIKHVVVAGDYSHIDQQNLQQNLMPLVSTSFFSVDIAAMNERLHNEPWVAASQIKRSWPDRIDIHIDERQAQAIWNRNSLLDVTGQVFSPSLTSMPLGLPTLSGPPGSHKLMLEQLKAIDARLAPLHLQVKTLTLTESQAWSALLNNGVIITLGQQEDLDYLQRFVTAYPKVVGARADRLAYIDLRYNNGFALRWR